jgi:hypothetical protein
MNSISRLALLFFCTVGAAQAAEPMRELGMPLGKKMELPIALCASEAPASPCWIKQPTTVEGGIQTGSLLVPASMQTTAWTTPGTYGAAIDREGVLRAVTVYSERADEYARIKGALSARFGKPQASHTDDRHRSAGWIWRDAVIELKCGGEAGCNTVFAFNDRGEQARQAMVNFRNK